jgi:glycosyltransferase involved in cell wall biosynthesis
MRVALLTGIFPPDIGGPATHSADLREELSRLGHRVTVATLWDGSDTDRRPGLIRFPRRWPWPARLAAVAAWLVDNRHRYDVVYATGLHPAAVAGARLADRPVVVKIVGDSAWERGRRLGLTEQDFERFQQARGGSARMRGMRWVRNWSLRHATAIMTPSEYLARVVEGWLEGPADVRVIANGVRRPPMGGGPSGSDDAGLRTIFVGRLVAHKRVGLLLEAVAATPGVSLEIVGEGPERTRLEDRARELMVDDRVTFTGAAAHDEVLERMAQAHALLLVSDYEGLPHVAIEALACGVPLVALPVGGTGSILHDGENAIVLPDASHQAIARALETLHDDAELRQRLADGARRSGAEWGMGRCATQVAELLERAVSPKPKAIFIGKSRIPTPVTEDFRRKLEILVRHVEPTVVGVGRPGVQAAGRAGLVRLPARLTAGLGGALFYSLGPALAVSLAAGRHRCAIVCQSPYEGFGALVLASGLPRSLRPRVVVEVHGDWRTAARLYGGRARRPLASFSDRAAVWAVRRADRVRVVSESLERMVLETGYGGDIDRFIAYSDMAEFLSVPLLAPPAEPRVAYVGALDGPKGADLLLEAWTQVITHVPAARLLIAGDGPLREDLVARCARLGLNGTAEFVGHLSSSEVRALLDGCSCLVVPSRSEGLGRVALEAMARARPVVAAKVGGLPELVEEGRSGRLVGPEDPEQLAAAIVELLQDPDELEKMGREGRRRALERDPLAEFESGIARLAAWVGVG